MERVSSLGHEARTAVEMFYSGPPRPQLLHSRGGLGALRHRTKAVADSHPAEWSLSSIQWKALDHSKHSSYCTQRQLQDHICKAFR
ncbi:hypothetical protein AV530_014331 [Patagioenas fasciata monilis]|uniref:Uncharacterized protein n=1 Tax=Patagioenas fasciata monilis TaxID=372326 RepID=A0A1V4KBD7_PATFA|nr:hypothetical protein AV530_014331 [Patagioenas fasciata monilis]